MLSLPPLSAETAFHIGSFPVTNTLLSAFGTTVLFAIFAYFLNLGLRKYDENQAPKGLVNFFESIIELVLSQIDAVTRDRKKTIKFLPLVGTLFIFIVVSNWLGIFPVVGSLGINRAAEFIPLFRSANSDLNLTLSMAVIAVIASHLLGIAAVGFFKYANKFVKLGNLWSAVLSGKIMNIFVAIVEFFVGLLEIVSEVAKVVSLSLRLFGNVFAGEVLLTVIASLIAGYGAFVIPLPFIALELLVGIIQATVFSMLTLVYLTIATTEIVEHGETHGVEAYEEHVPTV